MEQWLRHIESVHFRSIDLELERIVSVLRTMLPGGPRYRVITVAGTNGKGSAAEMLTCVLGRAGMKVGTYTSPHLVRYAERVRIDRAMVSDPELCDAFNRIEHARGAVPLTYFEFGTLAAILVFEDRGVDVAVMEVGMGGRLDAVNALDPEAVLVTNVALDHQVWLGPDREAIGYEKAGIFRRARPAVCADPDPPAAIAASARNIGAKLYRLGKDFRFRSGRGSWDWYGPSDQVLGLPMPAMAGEFQLHNAAGAVMLLKSIGHLVQVTEAHLREGLPAARLRGRFEVLAGTPTVILDVAHNAAAAAALRRNLESRPQPTKGRTLAVCGMLKDKPVAEISAILAPVVDAWYAGTVEDPRGCTGVQIAAFIHGATGAQVRACESVSAAFDAAVADAADGDRVLVFGSFHTVGDILRAHETDGILH